MRRFLIRLLALPLLVVVTSGCKPIFCFDPAGPLSGCLPQETAAASSAGQ